MFGEKRVSATERKKKLVVSPNLISWHLVKEHSGCHVHGIGSWITLKIEDLASLKCWGGSCTPPFPFWIQNQFVWPVCRPPIWMGSQSQQILWEKFSSENSPPPRASPFAASISEEQVWREASVVMVIYYRNAKKLKVWENRSRTGNGTRTSARNQVRTSCLGLHSFFTPQSVELCLQGPIVK